MMFGLFGGDKKRAAELYTAVAKGDLEGVRQALEKGADINALDPKCAETALHVAVEKSQAAVVELLLAKGANPDIVSNQHLTPLIIAAAMGDTALPMAELLIAGKANLSLAPTTGPNAGAAPLHIAASKGANAVLRLLLAAGTPPVALPNGSTLMHMAAISGNAETVEIASKAGISVDTIDSQSRTPLHLAAITGNAAAADGFLKLGADLECRDNEDCTPLMRAVLNNQTVIVAALLKNGANPDIVFTTGESVLSPLYAAAINGYDEVVKLLLNAGVPVEKKVGGLPSVVDMVQQAGHQTTVALLKEAIRQGKAATSAVKAEKKAGKLQSDLSTAIQELDLAEVRRLADNKLFTHLPLDWQLLVHSILGDAKQVTKLIAAGANPTTRFQELFEGLHPLYAAVSLTRDIATVEALLDGGADIELPCHDSGTALMLAVKAGQDNIAQLLLARGAKGNARDKGGLTALMLAASKGNHSLVDVLLDSGAEINAAHPENGLGSFGFAINQLHADLAKHLLDKGAKPDFGNIETLPLAVVEYGDLALIQAIEARGGSVIRDDMKARVAFVSARNKDGEVLDYVLNHGADLNYDNDFNYTPLILASLSNHPELVKRYLERGDDANSRDVDQETALSLAIEKDHRDVIALLRQHGAEERDYPGLSDEEAMLKAAADGALGTILKLRDSGISINTEDAAGNTPLMLAAKGGYLGVVRSLYHLGADINHRNHAGMSATKQAQELNQQLIITTMKEFVADDAIPEAMRRITGGIGGLYDFGDTMFGRMSHPYKGHPPYDNPSEDEEDGSAEEHELDEAISEKLDQLEELLGRKSVAEKLTQEQMEALREKIEEIRSGDFISNLAEEMEELEQLVELFSSVPEEDEELPPIFAAAAEGDIKAFRHLIKSGEGIDSVLPDGTTLLITATAHGQENIVAELIKSGANVSQARQDGFTALLLACLIGHEDIARSLLKAGSDVTTLYSLLSEHGEIGGCTALYIAAQFGHNNICQQLLKKGASVDAMNSVGYTPLMTAIKGGHEDVAILLLKAGANPDPEVVVTTDIGGIVSFTPLTLAASNEITGIVGALLKRKVNVDKPSGNGWTALKYAAKEGNVEIVKMLLKSGAAVDMADDEGWTPLMGAASEGHAEVVKLLLKAGANPNLQRNSDDEDKDGRTALMDAAFAGHIEVVAELLKGKANPNVQMADGRSALLSAIASGQSQVVDALLEAGADPSLGDEDAMPIEIAAQIFATDIESTKAHQKSLLQIMKSLILAGSGIGRTLFLLVNTKGDAAGPVIDELIPTGVNLNAKSESGLPILHFAARFGFGQVIKVLLQGNADVMARNAFGVLAYDLAVAYGHPDLALVFVAYMNKIAPAVDRQDAQGQTALVQAVLAGDESTVRDILTQGADATRRDIEGRTALSIAVQMNAGDSILTLRKSGAETIETPGLSATEAMILAAEQGALGTLMRLHDDGVTLEVTDEQGNTPLLIAAQNSHPGMLRALVAMGANIEHRNTEGNTAYMVAESSSRLCIMSALKELGYPG